LVLVKKRITKFFDSEEYELEHIGYDSIEEIKVDRGHGQISFGNTICKSNDRAHIDSKERVYIKFKFKIDYVYEYYSSSYSVSQ